MSVKKKKNYKTEWDLKKLFYRSLQDPAFTRDVKTIKKAYQNFEKKYKKSAQYITSAPKLYQALKDYEKLALQTDPKPLHYLYYVLDVDSTNAQAQAQRTKLVGELTKEENRVTFFILTLAKVTPKKQKEFLKNTLLKKYHYFLQHIFATARYQLNESEENILNINSLTSRQLWIQGVDTKLSLMTVTHQGKHLPLEEALQLVPQLRTSERRKLHTVIFEKFKEASDFAESEINAVYLDKKNRDELRGASHAYTLPFLNHHMDENVVLSLAQTVTQHFPIAHRFYKLKKKLLQLPHLTYADRNVSIGKIKQTFSFNDSMSVLKDVFKSMGGVYEPFFNEMLLSGQIDVFPRKGKAGGAYCSHSYCTPIMVLLNHVNTFRSLETLAHEMGHAIHNKLCESQPVLYRDYSLAIAETASTFFEKCVTEKVFETLSPREQIVALHDQIDSTVATIFRQVAVFNFELDLHKKIRADGFVAKEDIAKLMNHHMQAYLGPVFQLQELDGYFFVKWSHIRNFFYVYTYAFGDLVSRALYTRYTQDKTYLQKVNAILSAGGSTSPKEIFKKQGIDITNKKFFIDGLKSIENDIQRLETLTKRYT